MEIIRNFKSTFSLYGVKPIYFKDMLYYEAINEKIRLSKIKIKKINDELDYNLPEDEYKILNHQLRLIEKALKFNELLLDEYKRNK